MLSVCIPIKTEQNGLYEAGKMPTDNSHSSSKIQLLASPAKRNCREAR
jgi:hypothetical protein